jgi:uncharacterized membrane protein YdjX (TVP38/TMEM64 family)
MSKTISRRGSRGTRLPPPAHRLQQRLIVLAVLVGVAVLAVTSDQLYELMVGLVQDLEPLAHEYPVASRVVFAGLAAVSALLTFFSSTVLVPLAVQAWGRQETLALLWFGWVIGGAGAYAVGHWLGRPLARRLAGAERLEFYSARLGSKAPFGVVLLFHLALQSEIPGLVLGTLGYRFPLFLLALGLAEVPYAVGTVYLGSFVLERRTGLLLLGGALAAGAAVWAIRAMGRALEEGAADS